MKTQDIEKNLSGNATTPDPSFPKEGTTQLGLSASITTSANTAAIATEGKQAEATDAANGDIWLSPHFRLSEFTRSGAALRLRLENKPTPEAIDNLRLLCQHVLEPLRRRFGVIRVTSGYRSPALNKAVGGATHSQHLTGQAADIHAGGRESLHRMEQYAAEHLPFDQIIEEHRRRDGARWLHISYNAKGNRREQLTIDN